MCRYLEIAQLNLVLNAVKIVILKNKIRNESYIRISYHLEIFLKNCYSAEKMKNEKTNSSLILLREHLLQ